MSPPASISVLGERNATIFGPRKFVFERDSFAFANELIWEYRFDRVSGRTTFARRDPKPEYAHRCFVLTCAARQFLFHATFNPDLPKVDSGSYGSFIREILSRSPREPSESSRLICIPGYESLRDFSRNHEDLLKATCGGAWRSYVLRSHWRMVFPINRGHQRWTATQLVETVCTKGSAVVHLVRFPKLSINHGMIIYTFRKTEHGTEFEAYDPNTPEKPATLTFNTGDQTFRLPANSYWAGGPLDVIEIYRNWFL